jgi:hypothetical protein
VISDQTIAMDGYLTQRHYPAHLRRIRFKDPETGKTLIKWEFPRLCRGGSRSLTFPGVFPGFPSMKLQIVSRQSTRMRSSTDGRARKPKSQQVGV